MFCFILALNYCFLALLICFFSTSSSLLVSLYLCASLLISLLAHYSGSLLAPAVRLVSWRESSGQGFAACIILPNYAAGFGKCECTRVVFLLSLPSDPLCAAYPLLAHITASECIACLIASLLRAVGVTSAVELQEFESLPVFH